jgi:hypothetical protein
MSLQFDNATNNEFSWIPYKLFQLVITKASISYNGVWFMDDNFLSSPVAG